MIKVLLTDDHHLFREGLSRILEDAPDIDFVGSATSGEEAVQKAAVLLPDVILMDVNMPGMGGVSATQEICAQNADIRILMLTISEKENDLFAAMRAGAKGYLLKNASAKELLAAVRQVYSGEAPIAPAMAAKLVSEFVSLSQAAPHKIKDAAYLDVLTDREQDVLRLVAHGLSNKEIGGQLSISPLTVKAHLSSILDKLGLRGRVEAAAWAIRHGMLRGE